MVTIESVDQIENWESLDAGSAVARLQVGKEKALLFRRLIDTVNVRTLENSVVCGYAFVWLDMYEKSINDRFITEEEVNAILFDLAHPQLKMI